MPTSLEKTLVMHVYVCRCGRFVCATTTSGSFGAAAERRRTGEGPSLRHGADPAGRRAGRSLQHCSEGDGGKSQHQMI